MRDQDTVARLGCDEFVVMLQNLSEEPLEAALQTKAVGESVLANLNVPYLLQGAEHSNTCGVGATCSMTGCIRTWPRKARRTTPGRCSCWPRNWFLAIRCLVRRGILSAGDHCSFDRPASSPFDDQSPVSDTHCRRAADNGFA